MKFHCTYITWFLLVFFSVNLNIVYAFDAEGHKTIEHKAYLMLESRDNGKAILQFLKDHDILYNDTLTHTNFPDLSLERQFVLERQMYHFMAANRDVLEATHQNSNAAMQQYLLISSLPKCYEMMYVFYRELLINSTGAKQSGRGIYVLMHAIADSYSPEHTTRNPYTNEIITIKGWQFSRFKWPSSAKQELPDNTLLLLHRGLHADGDASWRDTTSLSPRIKAAEALKDLMILVYDAMQSDSDPDALFNKYILLYFKPANSKPVSKNFILEDNTVICYNYHEQYLKNRREEVYKIDRFPRYFLQGLIQTGNSTNFLGAYGITGGLYFSPTSADKKGSFFKRIPFSVGASVSEIADLDNSDTFFELLRVQAFTSVNFALPAIQASLEPTFGVGLFPFNTTHFSVPLGFNLIWNIGNDFGSAGHATKTLRMAVGYAFDYSNIPARNSFKIMFGINTWQTRFIKEPD